MTKRPTLKESLHRLNLNKVVSVFSVIVLVTALIYVFTQTDEGIFLSLLILFMMYWMAVLGVIGIFSVIVVCVVLGQALGKLLRPVFEWFLYKD